MSALRSQLESHPFRFLLRAEVACCDASYAAAIAQIEHLAADLILRNEPDLASPALLQELFMPYHQNGTFMLGERLSGNRLPFLQGEVENFDTWCRTAVKSDLIRILYARALPGNLAPHRFDEVASIVTNALQYRGSLGMLCNSIPNQNYIDYLRRALALYAYRDANVEFDTESEYNEFSSDVVLSIISSHLAPLAEAAPSPAKLRRLMSYSLLAGVIGLDMKCSHCAASPLTPDNAAGSQGNAPASRSEEIWQWLQRKEQDPVSYCPELFEWTRYEDLVLNRPCVLFFFSDDLGETLLDLFRIQAELTYNKFLRVVFVPRNGRYHNDFALADVEPTLTHPAFAALNRWRDQGRFGVSPHGPRSGAVEGPKMSRRLVESILDEADVLFFKGSRTYELLATGIRLPSFSGQTVSREFSSSVTGADASAGVPALRYFCCFPDFWGFKERFRNIGPMYPSGKVGWRASMTAIDSARYTASVRFRAACSTRPVEEVSLGIIGRAIESGVAPHHLDVAVWGAR